MNRSITPNRKQHIEDECAICHMPITRYEAKLRGKKAEVFSHLPFADDKKSAEKAPMASAARCATRSAKKSWERGKVSVAAL